jgi:hypothetical protein
MPHGQITRLEPEHGFGWLVERVIFDFESTPKGPRATDIALEFPQQVE